MKAPLTKTIGHRAAVNVSGILSFSLLLVVLLSGCEQAGQSDPPSQTTAQQQVRSNYPVIGGQTRQSGQTGQPEVALEDLSFFGRIEAGDVAGVHAALDAGADPNAKNAQGLSALKLAMLRGHSAIAEVLLERQPVLGVGETHSDSPEFESLQLAAIQGDIRTTQVLIDQGVDINVQDPLTHETSLFLAAQRGEVEPVKMLLENGANPNIKGPRGYPPLVEVAAKGEFEIAELLLQHRANPNATEDINKWTALMMAAARADAELVELLVSYGADVNITDPNGKTAIDIAYQRNDGETIAAIEAAPQSQSGFGAAKKEKTGLILIPGSSEIQREKEQIELTEPAPGVATAQPHGPAPFAPVSGDGAGSAETRKSTQVTQLLTRAQAQFQKKNLTAPKGDNALETCLEILELMPGHTDTIALVSKMEQEYRELATAAESATLRKAYTETAQELAALAQ